MKFREAVKLGRIFYGYKSSGLNDDDLNKRELKVYVEWRLLFQEQMLGGSSNNNAESNWIAMIVKKHVPKLMNNSDSYLDSSSLLNDEHFLYLLSAFSCCGLFPKMAVQLVRGRTYWVNPQLEFSIPLKSLDDALICKCQQC